MAIRIVGPYAVITMSRQRTWPDLASAGLGSLSLRLESLTRANLLKQSAADLLAAESPTIAEFSSD
jgi:exonuclease I